MNGDGPKVGEQLEAAAQCEQRELRSDGDVRVVPFWATDGTEEDGVALRADSEVLVADRDAVPVDRHATEHQLAPLDPEAEGSPYSIDHFSAGGADLGPDAVA